MGWKLSLIRVEDIGLGCAVSLVVGLFFWPRGASAAMGKALAEAYEESSAYLKAAVTFAAGRCSASAAGPSTPVAEAGQAAAAARRLDDAFRSYLAERGAKPVPLAEMTTLVTGVVGLRLAADAVLALWERAGAERRADRTAARGELLAGAEGVSQWFAALAASLEGDRPAPEPLPHDDAAERRLAETVRQDLETRGGENTAAAVRVIWTGDHLDAARRLQPALAAAART
ncbi:hypothetical protein GA0115240_138566, partial [Streptomyces sp. DvalAA-14]